jgi:hypothetical protein
MKYLSFKSNFSIFLKEILNYKNAETKQTLLIFGLILLSRQVADREENLEQGGESIP